MGEYVIHHGDCLEVLRTLADSSVDAVVTDPPYGLAFMGKRWDYDVPAVNVWAECLRVLKPGGHLLAFAGTRTQHRMAVRIEDAGFEIRDMIAWVYGSGFPKSLDVSKAIDKKRDDTEAINAVVRWLENRRQAAGVTRVQIEQHFGTKNIGQALFTITPGSKSRVATWDQWQKLKALLKFDDSIDDEIWRLNGRKGKPGEAWSDREVVAIATRGNAGFSAEAVPRPWKEHIGEEYNITAPATEAARQWSGWGTALKPAMEPITVARKPLIGTVAANVLEHGTGAINVDGCRVGADGGTTRSEQAPYADSGWRTGHKVEPLNAGRWPANLIHDGSEEVTELLSDSARFFYCAKASKRDRGDGNRHPTVKPTNLMRYLCRLITPPNGTILDPFTGSGSTAKAAMLEGFQFIGIEREAEYVEIAKARIEAAKK